MLSLFSFAKYQNKEVITMVQITQNEAMMLQNKGFKFGEMLHKTHTSHPKYYATEAYKVMQVLRKYRASRLVK